MLIRETVWAAEATLYKACFVALAKSLVRGVGNAGRAEHEAQERPDRGEAARDRRRRELAARPRSPQVGGVVGEHADIDVLERSASVPLAEVAQVGGVCAPRRGRDPGRRQVALDRRVDGHA